MKWAELEKGKKESEKRKDERSEGVKGGEWYHEEGRKQQRHGEDLRCKERDGGA